MLSNDFKPVPDSRGNPIEQCAAEILRLNPHAVVPNDMPSARRMLGELQKTVGETGTFSSPHDRRLSQFHECYNAMLPRLALAKRLGARPSNTKPPSIPNGGGVTADELRVMQEYASQLDIDIEEFQKTTAEQRRIMQLEARVHAIVEHSNSLVTAMLDYEQRIQRLEAVIQGPQLA
jgi:hypothetical protein